MKTYQYTSKKAIFAFNLFLVLFISNLFAQNPTWQWAKKGGTLSQMSDSARWEQIKAVETDANGNVYILSPVGMGILFVDGNPKQTYGLPAGTATTDYVIASFDCEGNYRWSKVIGGQEYDTVDNIQLDGEGNVYAVGEIQNNQDDFFEPGLKPQVHFDTDVVLPYAQDNDYNQRLFIIKYNSDGVFQWLNMPQAPDNTFLQSYNVSSIALAVDNAGNSFWLCNLGVGNYFNNQLSVTNEAIYFIKLNSIGNFQNANLVQMTVGNYTPLDFKMLVKENLDKFYLTKFLDKTPSANNQVIVGGENIAYSRFIATFDLNGSFLWKIQNNTTSYNCPESFEIKTDANNNIYFASCAGTVGPNDNPDPFMESFNGVQFPDPSDFNKIPVPYITKLDQNGNTLWQSSGQALGNTTAQIFNEGLGANNSKNEVAVVGAQSGLQWGNFSIQQAATSSYDPYVVRFNQDTGFVVGMHTFTSTSPSWDFATSINADNLGNYLVGGFFSNQVNIGSTNLQNSGGETDFFIAKLGTSNCALNVEKALFKDLKIYPNPVKGLLHIDNQEVIKYQLFNSLGMQIQTNTLPIGGTIDCSNLSAGFYILNLENQSGEKKVVKVLRE